jgi:hypothetical protein
MPKTVLKSKFREWAGLDRISVVVHQMKCIFREITKDDFGLDGEIEVVAPKPDGKGYETTGGIIKVQAKSGESYVKQDGPDSFITPIEKSDLEGWYNAPYPVFFIVYHPNDDKLYYKEIQSYVRSTRAIFQAPLHIKFDKRTDEFTPASYQRVAEMSAISPPRVAWDQREKLYSNLLLVKHWPKMITYAPTDRESYTVIRESVEGFLPPFTVREGSLYTLADLVDESCVLRPFCDTSRIRQHASDAWVREESTRRDYVFLLNQLLGSHVRRCGLFYNRDFRRNYFPRENDVEKVFRESWYNVRTGRSAPARIVTKYYEYGLERFWRHLALNLSFRHIGNSWLLQLVPKYFFTEDGEIPCPEDLVGPYTTGIKAIERNPHVLNHILFWTDVLSLGHPSIKISLYYKTAMVIEKEPFSGIANFGIPNDPAIYDEGESQPEFFPPPPESSDEGESDEYQI